MAIMATVNSIHMVLTVNISIYRRGKMESQREVILRT